MSPVTCTNFCVLRSNPVRRAITSMVDLHGFIPDPDSKLKYSGSDVLLSSESVRSCSVTQFNIISGIMEIRHRNRTTRCLIFKRALTGKGVGELSLDDYSFIKGHYCN